MPTPVGVARQCLVEAAAAVLDDAVAVAKRRSHAQTTSLHAVSALLVLPSSTLREACTRARSSAYSPGLQFRALELCVGVALDRVSVSKSVADEPPISNSLMAAIKRSQANQRRHPETFHLYQQQLSSNSQNPPSMSAVKVELKHFIMSILDDPIVSRVFDDAGFRTHEIKLAILNPLTMSRLSSTTSRSPPLFLCSLRDYELNKRRPNFPFPEAGAANERVDDNSRRIGEVLQKRSKRNPLLIGVCASDAYGNFIDYLKRGEAGILPSEIDGLRVASIEHEISEFLSGGLSEEIMRLKFKQVDEMVGDSQGPGILVSCGDMKAFVDAKSMDVVNYMVSGLKKLLIKCGVKFWLIGFLAGDDDYNKLVEKFPSIEMDWDLHLLTITTSIGRKCHKSSLMRSFVPFGGFFSMPSELERPCNIATQSSKLCSLCNEKCEQEVSAVRKGMSTDSVADKQLVNLSSWLQVAECETSKRSHTIEAKEDKTVLDARVMGLQRKWSDICQRLHCSWTSQEDTNLTKPHSSTFPSFQNVPIWEDAAVSGSLVKGSRITNLSLCMSSDLQMNSAWEPNIPDPIVLGSGANVQAGIPEQSPEMNDLLNPITSQQIMSTPVDYTSSSSSVLSVGTDLRLGTFHDSAVDCRRNLNLQEGYNGTRDSGSSRCNEKSPSQVSKSSYCSHNLEKRDLEHPWKVLAEKFYWQMEAIQAISQTVSRCRNGDLRCLFSNKGNVWLSFVGPDKVGKRKIAASVAEIMFGRNEHFLRVDLKFQDFRGPINSIIDCYDSEYHSMKSGRKMIVDYLAEELRKHPHAVVLLENVEKADLLVRRSLSQAVKTGKFPDSYGRDISINNVFVLASSVLKASEDLLFGRVTPEFPEEKILEAKNLQMQILVESAIGINRRNSTTNVSVARSKLISNKCPVDKRKFINNDSNKAELSKRACVLSRSIIDLNIPVEDMEQGSDIDKSEGSCDSSDDSERWLEDLLEHVDEKVVFKPFDFDSLSQKILEEINVRLMKVVGDMSSLEIHPDVMSQILAAAWLTDRENALGDWIEQVLCLTIDEARKKCSATSDFVMKLIPCDGLVVEALASGVCLPARINVN